MGPEGVADALTLSIDERTGEYALLTRFHPNGGSMSNGGASVADGILFVHSGYSHHRAIIPGNVLLAFTTR